MEPIRDFAFDHEVYPFTVVGVVGVKFVPTEYVGNHVWCKIEYADEPATPSHKAPE